MTTTLLAAGIDPALTILYVQSQLPEHTELHYLLECVTGHGEAHRMIQFKEKAGREQAAARLSLLTYPVLMAADILLHDTDEVPTKLADQYGSYRQLKTATTEAVIGLLAPIQRRYTELAREPDQVGELLAQGRDRARGRAAATVARARRALGLLT